MLSRVKSEPTRQIYTRVAISVARAHLVLVDDLTQSVSVEEGGLLPSSGGYRWLVNSILHPT